MQTIRILADDLTGALDSAGCFAGAGDTLPVVFDPAHLPEAGNCVASTDSRDADEDAAVARVECFRSVFDNRDGIAFKKIDSLLRGHVAAEIAHLVRGGDFEAAVIAPAFPALDRVTRNGRQWATLAGDEQPRMVGPDLKSDFARFGLDLRAGFPGAAQDGSSQIFLADAETDDDLRGIVSAGRRAGRVLWCGSAGLADILAGARPESFPVAAKRVLVVCGTLHPVAALQCKQLERNDDSAVISLRQGGDLAIAAQHVNDRLRGDNSVALAADFPQMLPQDARAMLGAVAKTILPKLDRPDALFVMGGDTLRLCCDALGAHRLAVRGLLVPGIPVSEFVDGEWAGVTVISKSGALGTAETLSDILAMIGAGRTAAGHEHSPQMRPRQKVPNH